MRKFCLLSVWVVIMSSSALAQSQAPKTSVKGGEAKSAALYDQYMKAFVAKDVNTVMSPKDLFVFDAIAPREYPSSDAYQKDWEEIVAAFPGPVQNKMSDRIIKVVGPVAYVHKIQRGQFPGKDGTKLDRVVR